MQINQDYPRQVQDLLIHYQKKFQKVLIESELTKLSSLTDKLNSYAITIAIFGMVSKGKTALLNALIGQQLGKTGATHGITKDVGIYEWTNAKIKLRLIDTPGIDEVNGELQSDLAIETAKQSDLILFVIDGDMLRLEQEAISQLQTFYKPILLVFNKIDLYPECDRDMIYGALQNDEMRKLISLKEIVLTSAEPKPEKVRIQYNNGQENQVVWEQPKPDVQDLKEKILDLLNNEGQALLAVNVLRALLEIQNAVTLRHIQKLQTSRLGLAFVFVCESITQLLSPSLWLDSVISGSINSLLIFWAINKYPSQRKYLWVLLVVAIAAVSGELGMSSEVTNYLQILWTGLSLALLSNVVITDIELSQGCGKFGAKELIEEIIQSLPEHSILQRFTKKSNHDEN